MQRVTVMKGLNCTKITTMFLQIFRSTVIVRLNCWLIDFLRLFIQQRIDCVLSLPLNERQCLVQAKQGVYAIKSHDNLRKKHQRVCVCVFFLL